MTARRGAGAAKDGPVRLATVNRCLRIARMRVATMNLNNNHDEIVNVARTVNLEDSFDWKVRV